MDTPGGDVAPEAKGAAVEIKGYATYSTNGGNAAGLTSQRSPQQNAQAHLIMDSTSQKKQVGDVNADFRLPKIASGSEQDFVQSHDIDKAFEYGF